jgi:MoxR-like ATPase
VQNIKYLNRIVDEELNQALLSAGAVLIEGPKWCGKTSTAKQASVYSHRIRYTFR